MKETSTKYLLHRAQKLQSEVSALKEQLRELTKQRKGLMRSLQFFEKKLAEFNETMKEGKKS